MYFHFPRNTAIELRSRWCLVQIFFTLMFKISCVCIYKKVIILRKYNVRIIVCIRIRACIACVFHIHFD